MRPNAPTGRRGSRRDRLLIAAVAIALAIALASLAAYVWYPTTLQPSVTLAVAPFVGTRCAPVLGGYANRFNTTITLANTGRADGDAAVQFLLGNFSMGFQTYWVAQGSQVVDAVSMVWEVHAAPTDCGPLDVPGPPAVALASVSRSPPIDPRTLIYATVSPAATLAFVGGTLGGLSLLARRRGISLFEDLGGEGWGIALLIVFTAGWFGSLAATAFTIPYNYPVDWTPVYVYIPIVGGLGVGTLFVAWRAVQRAALRKRRPPA